jgi:hypothetical protein
MDAEERKKMVKDQRHVRGLRSYQVLVTQPLSVSRSAHLSQIDRDLRLLGNDCVTGKRSTTEPAAS